MKGRYIAEITREVFDDLETNKYSYSEPRISIYGRSPHEFHKLGEWYVVFEREAREPHSCLYLTLSREYHCDHLFVLQENHSNTNA